jgi:hypothetical protein
MRCGYTTAHNGGARSNLERRGMREMQATGTFGAKLHILPG